MKRVPADHLILARRRQEDERMKYTTHAAKEFNLLAVAQWEKSTNQKQKINRVKDQFEGIQHSHEEELHERRCRLAAMLAEEEEQYKRELAAMQETPEERQDKMRARAMALREQREKERKAFAQEQLERNWRTSCDELREHDSHKLTLKVAKDREEQIVEKEALKEVERREEEFFAELWELDRQKKVEREEKDAARQRKLRQEAVEMLDKQKIELDERRAEAKKLQEEEMELLREKWKIEERQEKEKEAEMEKLALRARKMTDKFNRKRQKEQQVKMAKERAEDLFLLQQLLLKEKMEDDLEAARKAKLREEAAMYRKHLLEQMKKEAEDEALLNRLRQEEQEKAWQKRVDQWEKEKEARRKLMEDVMEERRNQIIRKLNDNKRAQEEGLRERERIMEEVDRLREREEALDAHRRQVRRGRVWLSMAPSFLLRPPLLHVSLFLSDRFSYCRAGAHAKPGLAEGADGEKGRHTCSSRTARAAGAACRRSR